MTALQTIRVLAGLTCVSGICVDPNAPVDAGTELGRDIDESLECVNLSPLRLWNTDPSAIAMLFTAEDCDNGRVLTGLSESAFTILEDNQPLSSEAVPRVLPSRGVRVYVTILIDMSSSTFPILAELQTGARRFVDEILVEQGLDNVFIGIDVFDGSSSTITLEKPTNDVQRLRNQLDSLSNFDGDDVNSTNLYGATRQTVQNLQVHQQRIMDRNYDGVVTTGYMLLLTDGGDTAGREEVGPARDAVASARIFDATAGAQPTVRTIAVGLNGDDYEPEALARLVGGPEWVAEASLAELGATFERVGREMGRRIEGTYLLAYCSASRAGDHSVTLRMADYPSKSVLFDFNADSFGGGCSAAFFETACDDRTCGGFNCGACEDATESCDGPQSGRCVNNCVEQNLCDGEQITNSLGYEQTCGGGEIGKCGGVCTDTLVSDNHCGACGNSCQTLGGSGESCVDGACVCPGGGAVCDGTCQPASFFESDANCGACGNTCPEETSCIDGACDCGEGMIACDGVCTDSEECGQSPDPDVVETCDGFLTCVDETNCNIFSGDVCASECMPEGDPDAEEGDDPELHKINYLFECQGIEECQENIQLEDPDGSTLRVCLEHFCGELYYNCVQ